MGLLSGIGSVIGGLLGMEGQKDANKVNKQLGYDQMGWQQMMSNTAHTREVADLRNAGLNPILSVNSGASTPPGALPQVKNTMEGLQASASEAMQLALAAKKQKAEISLMEANKKKTDTESALISKGIPKAEMENDFMRSIQNIYKKVKAGAQSNPWDSSTGLPERFRSNSNKKVNPGSSNPWDSRPNLPKRFTPKGGLR